MFGSAKQDWLIGNDRKSVFKMDSEMPFMDALKQIRRFAESYDGNVSDLRFGYWDYGGEIIITAPKEAAWKADCRQAIKGDKDLA